MEELTLDDLNFEESSINLFEEGKDIEKPNEINQEKPDESAGEKLVVDLEETKENKTDGDDQDKTGQESVANQDKESDQVQSGKNTDNGEGSNSSSPKLNETEQLYSNLAAEFKAKGVLPELDITKIKSLKDIEDAIQNRIESGLSDSQKLIREATESGAPVGEVTEKINTIEKLKSVTPEYLQDENNMEFRRRAIIQDFIQKGYGEERAQTLAQRSIDSGTDIEDAQFALNAIIETEEDSLDDIIESAKENEKKSLSNIKNYISDRNEIIPNLKLTDSQKDELYSQITTQVGDNRDNAFMIAQKKDPIGSRIKLETIFYLTKGLTDFSVFSAGQESKISNNIENLLRGAKFTGKGAIETNNPDKNSSFTLADLKNFEIE